MSIGTITGLFRYPVKSMAGEPLEAVELGGHGLAGDRRLAFRRVGERDAFPWLSASRLPEMVRYAPLYRASSAAGLPTHVRTPEGAEFDLFAGEFAAEVGRRLGSPVEMTYLDRGIFDEASVSVITTATIAGIARLAGTPLDVRRFRPNLLVEPAGGGTPFEEDGWVGGTLAFGDDPGGPAVVVTNRDVRCAMVNLDPDTGRSTPEVLRAIVRERDNRVGIYAAVLRAGHLAVGQAVRFTPARG